MDSNKSFFFHLLQKIAEIIPYIIISIVTFINGNVIVRKHSTETLNFVNIKYI